MIGRSTTAEDWGIKRWRLTGEYGTFTITREFVGDEDEAEAATGLRTDLEALGWTVDGPEGETWTVEEAL